MTYQTDHYYIEKIIAGDKQSYAHLVARYKDMVFTIALRMVRHREEAEEVAQDAFVKAYRSLKNYKGEAKFSTWLYRIAYNTCLDRIKKQKRLIPSEKIDDINEGNLTGIQDALSYMEAQERKQMIQDALDKLQDEQRVIITLFYFEELSVKEIADVTGMSVDNVKVRLFRGRKKLFTILENVVEPQYLRGHGAGK